MNTVDVITGARLHFGLICGTGESGWIFGGIGLMVQQPGWHLKLHRQPAGIRNLPSVSFAGDAAPRSTYSSISERITEAIERSRKLLEMDEGKTAVEVVRSLPLHSGLGSGTQLALAIASGMQVLWQHGSRHNLHEVAEQLGRAGRSAIGTAGFLKGGFIVDHGRSAAQQESRRLQRFSVSDEWRFILVRPDRVRGLSGDPERQYFERRCGMSLDLVRSLSGMIEERMIPALTDNNFSLFAETLSAYGQQIGRFYASEQGDVFSCPQMSTLASWLESHGVHGAAQSSWGPGICIPAASASDAEAITGMITHRFAEQYSGSPDESVRITVTSALNHGATIRSAAPEENEHRWL